MSSLIASLAAGIAAPIEPKRVVINRKRPSRVFAVVYAWMVAGLAITAATSWAIVHTPSLFQALTDSSILGLLLLSELGLVIAVPRFAARRKVRWAAGLFALYAGMNGVTLPVVLCKFQPVTVGCGFLITALLLVAISCCGRLIRPGILPAAQN